LRRFLLNRFLEMLLTLLALSLIVFVAVHATGDPARVLAGDNPLITPKVFKELEERWGLNDPLPLQYLKFMRSLLTALDFGDSLTLKRPVRDIVFERAPYTIQLALAGMVLAVALGLPAGVIAALRRGTRVDVGIRIAALTGLATPGFWLASMAILLFAATLGWLPAFGAGDPKHLILPAFVVALPIAAGIARITRSSMLDVLGSDFVRFARIKGLAEWRVIWKHALRNAAIPVITFGGLGLAGLLNGSIVVEVVFAWPGLGRLMVQGVLLRDVPLVLATTLLSATMFILTAFIVDVLYAFMDPRIRFGAAR
jgi:ABC-type dipeptide/oligopeptide/nickel transport system permease component